MSSLIATFALKMYARLTRNDDEQINISSLNEVQTDAFSSGTGDDQANQIWSDERTLAASTSEEIDLSGSLTNALGESVTFAKIRAIFIIADSANGGNIRVGGAASNAWEGFCTSGSIVKIPAGGKMYLIAPKGSQFAVTAGTADKLKIANDDAGAGATYRIVIVGTQ